MNSTAQCPIDMAPIISEIIRVGIVKARAAAWCGDAQRAAIEADHVHNLPKLFSSYVPEELDYYWNASRADYLWASKDQDLSAFEALWHALDPYVAGLPSWDK